MAVEALRIVPREQVSWPGLRHELDRSVGYDPYLLRMWREALMEADGLERPRESDPLLFPYVPFSPERFGLRLTAGSRVLDVGCLGGFGLFDFAMRRARRNHPVPRMVGVDVDPGSLALGQALARHWTRPRQLSFTFASGESLPFETGSFDLVIARSVLQYLRIEPGLAELGRMVRPGGLLLMQIHAPAYYFHQILRHLAKPLQAAYYGRALLSGMLFSAACVQPQVRWFREAGVTGGHLASLCRALGLEQVWSTHHWRRPVTLFRRR
ncbi:MAG TPA: class I SAM-dependent methyltransferase [Polyangia bacterium]|nr:class I SAM-dependent methyltransferase [Polyangia bacterium]